MLQTADMRYIPEDKEGDFLFQIGIVRQRNSIFLKKRAIASIENVFVYSDRYGHSDLKSD